MSTEKIGAPPQEREALSAAIEGREAMTMVRVEVSSTPAKVGFASAVHTVSDVFGAAQLSEPRGGVHEFMTLEHLVRSTLRSAGIQPATKTLVSVRDGSDVTVYEYNPDSHSLSVWEKKLAAA